MAVEQHVKDCGSSRHEKSWPCGTSRTYQCLAWEPMLALAPTASEAMASAGRIIGSTELRANVLVKWCHFDALLWSSFRCASLQKLALLLWNHPSCGAK